MLTVVLTAVLMATNLVGAAVVLAVIYLVLPLPQVPGTAHVELINGLVAAAYIIFAAVTGPLAGRRRLSELDDWLRSERPPDPRIRRQVVRAPLLLFKLQLSRWLGAALLFGLLDLAFSPALGAIVAPTIAITGITTGACAYLLAERILRAPAARALADEDPGRVAVPGVATRAVLAWAFGTAAPVLGLVTVGVSALAGTPATATQLEIVIVVLGAIAVVVGLLAVSLAARATADPIDNVRVALERIARGDFDARVPVYDGTQIGRLQLGFNRMAEGLGERERIRDMFGSYVDPAVAERILTDGVEPSGEEVEVTIMFIDIRGFTAFAERTEPRQVVAGINALFAAAIPMIHEHQGRVDKFVGDGLLAVFGAPTRLDDHADRTWPPRWRSHGPSTTVMPASCGSASASTRARSSPATSAARASGVQRDRRPGERGRARPAGHPRDRRHGAADRAHARAAHRPAGFAGRALARAAARSRHADRGLGGTDVAGVEPKTSRLPARDTRRTPAGSAGGPGQRPTPARHPPAGAP